jgi:hypothetical protein
VRDYRRSLWHRLRGERGVTRGVEKSGLRENLFETGAAAAEIGWIKVALLSLGIVGVFLGIGQGKIVDSGGDLGGRLLRFVGYSVGK